ncbi:MAG: site-2 protease family protein [Eubacteriaceae bacterium]|nr:site-2 protease family protein [Eubacteriaceae bacterium]
MGILRGFDIYRVLPGVFFGFLAITLHEYSHAYAAYLLGDNTAKEMGRLSLNPLKHIDPIGLVCFVLFRYGWAKPVPINPNNFENPRTGIRIVSIAGPAANMAQCLFCLLGAKISLICLNNMLFFMFLQGMAMNIGFAVFNLLPFPPLDGSKILLSFMPIKAEAFFYQYQKYFSAVFMALIYFGVIDPLIEAPIAYISGLLLKLIGF